MSFAIGFAVLIPLGCTEDGDDTSESTMSGEDDGTNDGMMGPPSFAVDIEPIISSTCVMGCHEVDGLNDSLILSDGAAYDNLVEKMSGQLPQMFIVDPGNKSVSYLWHKLNNTHIPEGGSGAQMPFEGQPLPAAQLILMGNWIDDGAMP